MRDQSSNQSVVVFLPDEQGTQSVGQKLANSLSRPANIHLSGPLGAGKTTLTRAFLKALGVSGSIKSPTYTLLEPYKTSSYSIYHFDFYRFFDQNEWEESGFRDYFSEHDAVCLVEWAEKAGDLLPEPDIKIELAYGPNAQGRQMTLFAISEGGRQIVDKLTRSD